MSNPLHAIRQLGQHLWLDNLSRSLLREGTLQRLVEEDGIDGVTSNPAIFHKALTDSPYYRDEIASLRNSRMDAEARYESLVIPDIREACDLLRPTFERGTGVAGHVSLEISPHLADDEAGSVAAALRLREAVDRPNLMIKVPATAAGIRAFERLTAAGVRVNVTLMFSVAHYQAVAAAYLRGAAAWLGRGGDPRALRSVASVFMSRVDTLIDGRLTDLGSEAAAALRGRAAVALGKLCYRRYREIFHGPEFAGLAAAGVTPQFPLWASTGTKNPDYGDLHYVEPLIGPETVNTLPDATLSALREHGRAEATLSRDLDDAEALFVSLRQLGIDPDAAGETLQSDGVRLFVEAYDKLLRLLAG